MSQFIPYRNESDVLNIGGLQIENRLDRVTISGDLDLTADQLGLEQARALHQLLGEVVARLQARPLAKQLPPSMPQTVANPFD
jgi:hypothetical protein